MFLIENRTEFLNVLAFPNMEDREEDVTEAYARTFDPIILDDDSHLNSWFRSDEPLFWISGKAGSGKTTFMKHLYQHENTHKHLATWAAGASLTIARFFFSESGTELEKSREGLFRSLLFQILRHCPELIPKVSNSRASHTKQNDGIVFPRLKSMSWRELQRLFGEVLDQVGQSSKVCLFIDGLDECRMPEHASKYKERDFYLDFRSDDEDTVWGQSPWITGGHQEIARLFTDLTIKRNVKTCLSSRPLNSFQESFKSRPRLRLQEFTADGISAYCKDKLFASEAPLGPLQHQQTLILADEIVRKADGVWLWVDLAIKRILTGREEGDYYPELQAHLDRLPEQLGGRTGLYMQMLQLIKPDHRAQGASLFDLFLTAFDSFDLLDLSFAEEGLSDGYIRPDEDCLTAVTTSVDELQESDFEDRAQRMQRRLQSRCSGLIEDVIYNNQRLRGKKSGHRIQFMHQTVKEFLSDERIWDSVFQGHGLATSECRVVHLNASILKLKTILGIPLANDTQAHSSQEPHPSYINQPGDISEQYAYIKKAVWYARYLLVEKDTEEDPEEALSRDLRVFKLLDELGILMERSLDRFVCHLDSQECGKHWTSKWHPQDETPNYLSFAIKAELPEYVEYKLQLHPSSFRKPGRPLLSYAIDSMPPPFSSVIRGPGGEFRYYQSLIVLPNIPLVQCLLHCKADPNEQYRGLSAWQKLVDWGYDMFRYPEKVGFTAPPLQNKLKVWLQLVGSMLAYGVNPYIRISRSREGESGRYATFYKMLRQILERLVRDNLKDLRYQVKNMIDSIENKARETQPSSIYSLKKLGSPLYNTSHSRRKSTTW